jgi:hypothetical protein
MYLIGEFQQQSALETAIRRLRDNGAAPADLDIFSFEPVELPAGVLDRPSRMSFVSIAMAIAVGSFATAFIYYTQHDYKLVTGGMPLFSMWATGVISYEMTMFGAMLGTFAWFLWESGLLSKRDKRAPVPEVDPDTTKLRVRCESAQAHRAAEIMSSAGALQVERRGE